MPDFRTSVGDSVLKTGIGTAGSDGYIGGFMNGSSETDLVVITGLPPLVNPIDDANFSINVGAYTNGAYPASVYTAERVVQTNETLQVGPACKR